LFLKNNYLGFENGIMKVVCEKEKFIWAIKTPGYIKDLHLLIKNQENEIVAMLTTSPRKMSILG
jgi:hypothetical protein